MARVQQTSTTTVCNDWCRTKMPQEFCSLNRGLYCVQAFNAALTMSLDQYMYEDMSCATHSPDMAVEMDNMHECTCSINYVQPAKSTACLHCNAECTAYTLLMALLHFHSFFTKVLQRRSTTWRSCGSSQVWNVQRIILHSHDSNGCFLCLHPFWAENQHPSTFFSLLQLVSSNTSWMQPRGAVKAQLGVTAVLKCRKRVVFWNLPHCCPPLVHLL